MVTGAFNDHCSDFTLPIANWLLSLEGGTYAATLLVAVSPIHSSMSGLSW